MVTELNNARAKVKYGSDSIEGLFITVETFDPNGGKFASFTRSQLRDKRDGDPCPLTLDEIVEIAGHYGFDISCELEGEPECQEGCGGGCEYCCNRGL